MFVTRKYTVFVAIAACWLYSTSLLTAQVPETQMRYVRVGTLQSRFTACGSERAWNNVYYEGMIWPADYNYSDNAVIERTWIGSADFTDSKAQHWEDYCVSFTQAFSGISVFPMVHKQTAKIDLPTVYVDGSDISAPYRGDYDEIDPNLVPDRLVTNVVNTSMGVTMTRRIYAFSQQYHDNYFIKEWTFKNTGYVNATTTKVLNATVKGFRFGFGVRYSVSREGSFKMGDDQSYGKHTWVTRRGEDYATHANDKLTEASPIPQWLRAGFCWAGQNAVNVFDNIGGPDRLTTGRFCGPQFAGMVTLHVDKSATNKADDPSQPNTLGWHAGDTYPSLGDMTIGTAPNHILLYKMLSGVPYTGQGNPSERMWEVYHDTKPDPWIVHGDGGGTNLWINYGPFDLAPGDSVVIVVAEGVAGLDRDICWQLGARWKKAYDNTSDKGPFVLPDGSTTTDKDIYKDTWIYTGKDSIMKTFSRAKRNYDLGYQIPQPPLPPPLFNVSSGGDRISLSWDPSPSKSNPGFGGYKVFRATGKPDTTFKEIASLGPTASMFDDVTAQRGFAYYYYVSAFFDGSNNTSGGPNPTGPLLSSRFYTKTNQPAYLQRAAGPPPQIAVASLDLAAIKKDTNTVEFGFVDNLGGKSAGFVISDFNIALLMRSGASNLIIPPAGTLPLDFHNAAVGSRKSLKLLIDTAGVASASYTVKAYDVKSLNMIEMFVNGQRQNIPATIVTPFKSAADAIRIVPNPYNIAAPGAQYPGEPDKIMFLNIPGHCLIKIYTENGDLINTISHENGSGDETWNSNTSSRQVVVSGVYIVHFTVTEDFMDPLTNELKYRKGDTAYQKLIIIR